MTLQPNSNRPLHFIEKIFSPKNIVNPEAEMSRGIQSCFHLAKMVVTKAKEIKTTKQKTILVADDEPLTFELIKEFLAEAHLSCHLISVTNGRQACEFARSLKPDLIIADWIMPELDGLNLIKELKANPGTRNIPIIMTTGALIPNAHFNEFLEAGAIDCIRKPFDDIELVARVKTALALDEAFKEIKENNELIHTEGLLLSFLMDIVSNPIFFTDRKGRILRCNAFFEKLIGKRKSDVIGSKFNELLAPTSMSGTETDSLLNVHPGEVNRFQIEFQKHSENKHLLVTCIGLGNTSTDIIVSSITDITEIIQPDSMALMDAD